MKKLIALMLVALVAISAVACTKKEKNALETIKAKGTITIATSPDYAPFEFVDPSKTGDAQYVGADIELMKYIAKELGVTLVIQSVDFDTTLTLLTSKSVDLSISGFTYKASRAEIYDFTNMYYDEGNQVVMIPADSTYTTLEQISVETLAGQNASLQYDFISEYIYTPYNSTKKAVAFTQVGDGLNMLKAGTAYGLVLAKPVADGIIENNKNTDGTPKYKVLDEYIPVPKEQTQVYGLLPKNTADTSLLDAINKIIEDVITKDLYQTWFDEAQTLNASLNA